jgi:hypothetical protein
MRPVLKKGGQRGRRSTYPGVVSALGVGPEDMVMLAHQAAQLGTWCSKMPLPLRQVLGCMLPSSTMRADKSCAGQLRAKQAIRYDEDKTKRHPRETRLP